MRNAQESLNDKIHVVREAGHERVAIFRPGQGVRDNRLRRAVRRQRRRWAADIRLARAVRLRRGVWRQRRRWTAGFGLQSQEPNTQIFILRAMRLRRAGSRRRRRWGASLLVPGPTGHHVVIRRALRQRRALRGRVGLGSFHRAKPATR